MTAAPDLLAERYGAPPRWRRPVLIAIGVALAAAFAGWLAWVSWDHATPAVESELLSFEVVDEHRVDAVVDVDLRDDDVAADCLLRAFAEDHTTVGELSFTPTASGRSTVAIRTDRRATSVEKVGCTADGQIRPR